MSYFTDEEINGYIDFKWKIFKLVGPICLGLLIVVGIMAVYANRTKVNVVSHSWMTQCSIMKDNKEVDYCHSEGDGMNVIPPQYELDDDETMDVNIIYYVNTESPSGKPGRYRVTEEMFYQMEDGKSYSTKVEQDKITKIY